MCIILLYYELMPLSKPEKLSLCPTLRRSLFDRNIVIYFHEKSKGTKVQFMTLADPGRGGGGGVGVGADYPQVFQ